jgi:two-component system LytT family sensor kinase
VTIDAAAGPTHSTAHFNDRWLAALWKTLGGVVVNLKMKSISQSVDLATPVMSSRLIWIYSFAAWSFIAAAATMTVYQFYRLGYGGMHFTTIAGMECSQILSYAPLTPFVFLLALKHPLQRDNWWRRSWLYVAALLAFALVHIVIWGVSPYAYWDPATRGFHSAFWDAHAHIFRISWMAMKSMLFSSSVDDLTEAYIPTLLIAHAVLYYRWSQEKELRATQLARQLVTARLQTLKSQMQPHFLFNTLHSISALMLTNVVAADRMMTSLSDLLRMSLENNGTQLTTLSHELEFLAVYVEIEKARFEDKLRVSFDIEPECLDAQFPHLLLQPLVENAVRHGTSKVSRQGKISILIKRDRNNLEVWVSDNGPGLAKPAEEMFRRGLGLSIARERLETLYGDRQVCNIRSRNEGTEVYLRMPFFLVESAAVQERFSAATDKEQAPLWLYPRCAP